jgi:hypothetical protein
MIVDVFRQVSVWFWLSVVLLLGSSLIAVVASFSLRLLFCLTSGLCLVHAFVARCPAFDSFVYRVCP